MYLVQAKTKYMKHFTFALITLLISLCLACEPTSKAPSGSNQYQDLLQLYQSWRNFETPPLRDDAPDYTAATFQKRQPEFQKLQTQLLAMDTSAWSISQRVDWHILWAEMNGYDFNRRVLQPWARDPAFYQSIYTDRSDVPAHEGPTHHRVTELWTYQFPLSKAERERLLQDLWVIPGLNEQAKLNLTGNAKDLWIAGIRDIRTQSADLEAMLELPGVKGDQQLEQSIETALNSTKHFTEWLEKEAPKKTGPSGIGKENYSWYLQNVMLVPLTWEDEVMLLKRELARAWTALKLEEHHNRNLPQLKPVESPEAYEALAKQSAQSLMQFLDKDEMLSLKDYFTPALEVHLGKFVPQEKRNFFWITAHHDPRPLYSHFYHWFELALMDREPHTNLIRRAPLLYNIFVSHNEGIATAVEEIFMQAGLYEDSPRSREIVYIMLAQRAARGLGSLYAHANEMTMEEAGGIHMEYTPRGWMKTEPELRIFEQHLYLRQPGYGTSYVTGKYLIESAIMDVARLQELKKEPFQIRAFLDQFNALGNIPVALAHWEMTGVNPLK